MLTLANRHRDGGVGWVLDAAGRPMSPKDIAHFAGRDISQADVKRAIEDLVAVGTLIQLDDGTIGFPNLCRWQEPSSAERMRRKRQRDLDAGEPEGKPLKIIK